MKDYTKIINSLQKKGIEFIDGLTDEEINYIQKLYNITFPQELKKFLQTKLPINKRFL